MAEFNGYMLCTVVLFVLGFGGVEAVKPVVVPPVRNSTTEASVIIVPGAGIPGLAYQPLAKAIQQASDFKLWVVLLTDFLAHTPNPLELPSGVSDAISTLQERGMKSNNIFLAGHSLGGVFVGMDGSKYASQMKGVLLLASYLTRDVSLATYPLPVLHLSGDLDGQTRITRIADTFQKLENNMLTDNSSMIRTPVIVMRGVSHAQFASGPMPTFVKENDLTPEVSSQTAYQLIANHTASFIATSILSSGLEFENAKKVLEEAYVTTKDIMKPLLVLKSLETNEDNTDHWGMSAQYMISLLTKETLQVNSRLVSSELQFTDSTPVIVTSGTLTQVTTYGYVTFPTNPMDLSTIPSSSKQVAVKMKSFEAIHEVTNHPVLPQGGNLTCMDINQMALKMAQNYSSALANQRYKSRGRPIFFLPDSISSTALGWMMSSIDLHEDDQGLHVRSSGFKSPLDSGDGSGMHYCTLLSPYRAAEWMYVDSLRAHPMPSVL